MKKTATLFAIVLFALTASAADLEDLTDEQRQTFEDGVMLTAMNIAGSPPSTAQASMADVFLSRSNPPYAKLWQMARVLDNSASAPCGTASGTDLAIDSCSIANVNSIIAGSFALLADATFPDAE